MKFTKNILLPRFRRPENPELGKFIVSNINKELAKIKNGEHYDLVQMQYFLESAFNGKENPSVFTKNMLHYK